jgi:hypothetical protein
VLDRKVTLDEVADHDRMGEILAVQPPRWEPGTRHGYHAVTGTTSERRPIAHRNPPS